MGDLRVLAEHGDSVQVCTVKIVIGHEASGFSRYHTVVPVKF
jgi:hypothetical protein